MKLLLSSLLLIFFIGCGVGTQRTNTPTTVDIKKKVVSDERLREVRRWIRMGRLGFDFNQNKAFVDPHLWGSMNYDEKFELDLDLATYIANKKKSNVYEVIIVDKSTAYRMAEYNKLGFRRYENY